MRRLLWCLLGLSMGAALPAWAETYHIPGAGNDIAYVLLHSAGPGDIIEINTGGELGAFNVTDETGLQIIVSPAGLAPTSTGVGGSAATIHATGVSITGLRFETSGTYSGDVVEVWPGGSCTFSNCTFDGTVGTGSVTGLAVYGPSTLPTTLVDCNVESAIGVVTDFDANAVLTDCTIDAPLTGLFVLLGNARVATSNSSTCGRVKLLHPAGGRTVGS
jgi:hypothetical protein